MKDNQEAREPGPERPSRRRSPDGPRGRRRGGAGGGRGFGRPGGWQQADLPPADDAAAWFVGRLPEGWFVDTPMVSVDREEIIVTGEIAAPEATAGDRSAAALGRITRFREDTRESRMKIAAEAETRYGRKVGWGASIGETRVQFAHLAVPVMTRLRQDERRVLDTLVDSGVARSRSEALAWCVKLVGEHTDAWLSDLRSAMADVDKLRSTGPAL